MRSWGKASLAYSRDPGSTLRPPPSIADLRSSRITAESQFPHPSAR
ncbi:MAG: hypothetical protein JHC24_03540 [Thaumarchaeota archaeon]|nr:hypothetical protein [Nitrososphaerota archaeon]